MGVAPLRKKSDKNTPEQRHHRVHGERGSADVDIGQHVKSFPLKTRNFIPISGPAVSRRPGEHLLLLPPRKEVCYAVNDKLNNKPKVLKKTS